MLSFRSARILITSLLTLSVLPALAEGRDSVSVRRSFFSKAVKSVVGLFETDSLYIEPSHYQVQALLNNKYSYEVYSLSDNSGNSITFKPEPSFKVGPMIVWQLLALGWNFDVLHLGDGRNRKEFDLSLYTLPFGIDIFWRHSGNDYKISDINLNTLDARSMRGAHFRGLESSMRGFNFYWITNHERFSYPAAFNQSTRQKISCGSPMLGIGFTRHSLKIDWHELNAISQKHMGMSLHDYLGSDLLSGEVTYSDLQINCGYGYNWVFARNLLFASSLSIGLSYKRSISESTHGIDVIGEAIKFRDFKISDLTFDGVGRFGFVWTNDRWFSGASVILHAYNYSNKNFYTNNVFGSLNIYVGFNFGVKKQFKKNK